MENFYTLMVIPDRDKKVKTFKLPAVIFRSLVFLFVISCLLVGIFIYDYWNILQKVYENKHLSLENKQLKEQIQLFQMKINTIGQDLKRINTFEKKLRIISGLEKKVLTQPYFDQLENKFDSKANTNSNQINQYPDQTQFFNNGNNYRNLLNKEFDFSMGLRNLDKNPDYIHLSDLYEKKILTSMGVKDNYEFSRTLNPMTDRLMAMAKDFALFDYTYDKLKKISHSMEVSLHKLDQYLLDRDSMLKSTPVVMPTNGWITSYYGPRTSPYSGQLKMHEGIDIGAPYGADIFAPADGVVVFSGTKPGFGKHIQIDHGYGIETLFAHSQSVVAKKGDIVKRGTVIAKVGSTGHSTGPHLHYEIRINGVAVDPFYFLLNI
jgi:murein DD-endopeptidase MepM/ murein hydrolase activator NlpD